CRDKPKCAPSAYPEILSGSASGACWRRLFLAAVVDMGRDHTGYGWHSRGRIAVSRYSRYPPSRSIEAPCQLFRRAWWIGSGRGLFVTRHTSDFSVTVAEVASLCSVGARVRRRGLARSLALAQRWKGRALKNR